MLTTVSVPEEFIRTTAPSPHLRLCSTINIIDKLEEYVAPSFKHYCVSLLCLNNLGRIIYYDLKAYDY